MYSQQNSGQTVHREVKELDEDDLLQRQKLLAKEPEVPEKYVNTLILYINHNMIHCNLVLLPESLVLF